MRSVAEPQPSRREEEVCGVARVIPTEDGRRNYLDQACADLVNQAHGLPDTAMKTGHEPGCDKFRGVYPQIDWEIQLEHGEKVGLGQRAYELVRLVPKDEKW